MGEVSEEIELDLGLSIGGSFKRSEKPSDENVAARGVDAPRRKEAKRKRETQVEARGGEFESGERQSNQQVQFPIVQVQFPIQYVPLSNGFAIPYVVPCWAPPNGAFQASSGNGCESEQNGSALCSSSVVSDNRSSSHSHEGVNSGETRSHMSHSRPDQPQTMTDGAQIKFEQTPSSNILQPMQSSVKAIQNEKAVAVSSTPLHSNPVPPNREASEPKDIKKPAAPNTSTQVTEVQPQAAAPETQTGPAKTKTKTKPASEGEAGKPPKPQTQNQCLPQMPCVSTTGNGPNGKTVTGFLYRYTNAEVSIVCVCHGSSFSPAEFVAHAGGTGISNPLRHITVIPSALG